MKLRLLTIGLWTAGLLTACSDSGADMSSKPTTPAASSEVVSLPTDKVTCTPNDSEGTVTIWHSMSGPAAVDLWKGFELEFERTHKARLEVLVFAGDKAIIDRLETTPRDQWPDLIDVSERNTLALLDTQQFVPPVACDVSFGSDLLPLVRATYSVNDVLVAAPFGVSTPVLIFDAAEFRAANLDLAEPPLTLGSLLDASRAIADSGASPYGLVVTDACVGMVTDYFSAQRDVATDESIVGHEERTADVNFATDENIADLTLLAQGVADGHIKYIGGSESNMDDLLELANSTDDGGSMTVHTSGSLGDIIRLLGNFPGVELGVGPLPGPGVGAPVGGNAFWLTSNSDATQVGRAWSVVEWLYEAPQLARLAIETGYVPPTESAAEVQELLDRWDQYPQLKVAYDQVRATAVTPGSIGSLVGPFNGRAIVLNRACDKIMANGADVRETLLAASEAVNELLAQYEAQRLGQELPEQVTTVSIEAPTASAISGTVECASGAQVVGVWVEAEASPSQNSGWAAYQTTSAAAASYQFTLQYGGRYQLHVGCGGTENDWGSSSFTNFISSSSDFLCHDVPPRRGVCDTL